MQQINWRKSSYSGTGPDNNCMEAAAAEGRIHIRESDDPATSLTTTRATLLHFLRAAKAGCFDQPQ
ncbi:hypothetical protein ACZ90_44285 [Streptomyces albus subsp. albus]|nr:hypothetical protein ACZ90_44285 [Streptomyces albus subsp. albus]